MKTKQGSSSSSIKFVIDYTYEDPQNHGFSSEKGSDHSVQCLFIKMNQLRLRESEIHPWFQEVFVAGLGWEFVYNGNTFSSILCCLLSKLNIREKK